MWQCRSLYQKKRTGKIVNFSPFPPALTLRSEVLIAMSRIFLPQSHAARRRIGLLAEVRISMRKTLIPVCCLFLLAACAHPAPPSHPPRPSVKVKLEGFSKWQHVCDSERSWPTFLGNGVDIAESRSSQEWARLYDGLEGKSEMDAIRAVQHFVNSRPYAEDRDIWGIEDHWATPREFLQLGGDCEDFAIAKYFALRELGIAPDAMRIAGVWNRQQGRGHAVLLVDADREVWVLDNLESEPVPLDSLPHYVPLYYVNENNIWTLTK